MRREVRPTRAEAARGAKPVKVRNKKRSDGVRIDVVIMIRKVIQ